MLTRLIIGFEFSGLVPKTRQEKDILRKMIRDSPVADEGSIKLLEENFEEAIRYTNTCLAPPSIPHNVQVCAKTYPENVFFPR